jgi:hypothetical protein
MYTGSLKSIAASVGGSFTSVPFRNTACKAKGTREPRDAWGVESIAVGGDSLSDGGDDGWSFCS